jgi:hypothetical protein
VVSAEDVLEGIPACVRASPRRQPPAEVIDPILAQVIDDLESRVPVRDEHGDIPAWLREMCWSAAIKKLQVTRCARFLAHHAEIYERRRWRPRTTRSSRPPRVTSGL